MERFDVLIVGAGPAGSTAAYRLADVGASVLLVDRARFPRDKPCGGGVTYRALRELPVTIDSVVEDVVDRFEIRFRYGRRFERSSPSPLCLMTQRSRLDAHLVEHAAAAGADLRDGVRVSDLSVDSAGVTARVDGDLVRAPTLIAADGANGMTARAAGIGGGVGHGVALEGNVPYEYAGDCYRGRLVLEIGVVPGGYAWVFPKGDHVNVGVGGWAQEAPRLRGHLARLCREHEIDLARVESVRGYRLPYRQRGTVLARGRALAVGDAAGLVDPLSGDGIYEALVSARLASDAVLDLLAGHAESLEAYSAAVDQELGALTYASWAAKRALDRFPRSSFAIVRSRLLRPAVEQIIRGETKDLRQTRGRSRLPLAALRLLADRAPATTA
jgi:geranylgeranyl reductase family protein